MPNIGLHIYSSKHLILTFNKNLISLINFKSNWSLLAGWCVRCKVDMYVSFQVQDPTDTIIEDDSEERKWIQHPQSSIQIGGSITSCYHQKPRVRLVWSLYSTQQTVTQKKTYNNSESDHHTIYWSIFQYIKTKTPSVSSFYSHWAPSSARASDWLMLFLILSSNSRSPPTFPFRSANWPANVASSAVKK